MDREILRKAGDTFAEIRHALICGALAQALKDYKSSVNVSEQRLADLLCMSRSHVSHLLSGQPHLMRGSKLLMASEMLLLLNRTMSSISPTMEADFRFALYAVGVGSTIAELAPNACGNAKASSFALAEMQLRAECAAPFFATTALPPQLDAPARRLVDIVRELLIARSSPDTGLTAQLAGRGVTQALTRALFSADPEMSPRTTVDCGSSATTAEWSIVISAVSDITDGKRMLRKTCLELTNTSSERTDS